MKATKKDFTTEETEETEEGREFPVKETKETKGTRDCNGAGAGAAPSDAGGVVGGNVACDAGMVSTVARAEAAAGDAGSKEMGMAELLRSTKGNNGQRRPVRAMSRWQAVRHVAAHLACASQPKVGWPDADAVGTTDTS